MVNGRVLNLCNSQAGCRDLQFGWQLSVSGVTVHAIDIRWEQWVRGGHDIFFEDGASQSNTSLRTIPLHNPKARISGPWIEDLVSFMPSGPKPIGVNRQVWAECRPSGGRAMEPRIECGTYLFDDTPGFEKDIGDQHRDKSALKIVQGVLWNTTFVHKLWRAGQERPFYVAEFTLTGGVGKDHTGKAVPARKITGIGHHIDEKMMGERESRLRWYVKTSL